MAATEQRPQRKHTRSHPSVHTHCITKAPLTRQTFKEGEKKPREPNKILRQQQSGITHPYRRHHRVLSRLLPQTRVVRRVLGVSS